MAAEIVTFDFDIGTTSVPLEAEVSWLKEYPQEPLICFHPDFKPIPVKLSVKELKALSLELITFFFTDFLI
jgi:hypothetical protein